MKSKLFSLIFAMPFFAMAQLSIPSTGVTYTIDFDNSVMNVNNGPYAGGGFSPNPGTGSLNSKAWRFDGMNSPAFMDFNGTANSSTDGGRGVSNGGVTTSGFYGFNTADILQPNDRALGWQATDAAFTPGDLTLLVVNSSPDSMTAIRMAYELKELNNGNRSTTVTVSYSFNDTNYTDLSDLGHTTAEAVMGTAQWQSTNKTTVINDTLLPGDTLYIRWISDDNTGTGLRDEIAIDDIAFRTYDADFLWDGAAWSPSEPGSADALSDALVLPGGLPAPLNNSTSLNSITVNPGAALDIKSDLTVVAAALFEADGSGYSQVMGPITGPVFYEIYLVADSARWFNLAFPVDTDLTGISGIPLAANGDPAKTNVWYYDAAVDADTNGEGDFKPAPALTFDTERIGFQVYAGDSTYFGSAPFTVVAEGPLLEGDQSMDVSALTDSNFNILPNPYPSTLNWDSVYFDPANAGELQATYYVQDGSINDSDYNYRYYSAAFSLGDNGGFADIPPGLSFFVQVTNSTDGTILFKNSHRNLTGNSTLYKTRPKYDYLSLKVKNMNKNLADKTYLVFGSALTDNYETVDAGKMMNGGYPNLYTRLGSKNYLFNGISDQFSSRDVALYFQGDYAGNYQISMETDLLPASWTVELEDKLTGTKTDIRSAVYSFNHQQGNGADRFVLHLNKQGVGLGEDATNDVYSHLTNGKLTVELGSLENAQVEIFDVGGKLMYSGPASSGSLEVSTAAWAHGVYLVNVVKEGEKVYTNKLIN